MKQTIKVSTEETKCDRCGSIIYDGLDWKEKAYTACFACRKDFCGKCAQKSGRQYRTLVHDGMRDGEIGHPLAYICGSCLSNPKPKVVAAIQELETFAKDRQRAIDLKEEANEINRRLDDQHSIMELSPEGDPWHKNKRREF